MIKHIRTSILLLLCLGLCVPVYGAVTSTTSIVTVQGGYSKRAPASEIVNAVAADGVTTLKVSGASILDGGLIMDTDAFTVADTTGDTGIGGTLDVVGVSSLDGGTKSTLGIGAKNGETLSAVEWGSGTVHQTVLTLTDTTFTFVDDGTTGHVATKIYDLPEGYIQTLGASTDLACTSAGTFGATGTAVFSIGTTATADSTLDSTDANIIASTSSGAFVASEGTLLGGPVSAPLQIDGHSTAADVYLNLGDASDPSDDSILTCSGTITLTWMGHGDN